MDVVTLTLWLGPTAATLPLLLIQTSKKGFTNKEEFICGEL
jgi:hypothetical protein